MGIFDRFGKSKNDPDASGPSSQAPYPQQNASQQAQPQMQPQQDNSYGQYQDPYSQPSSPDSFSSEPYSQASGPDPFSSEPYSQASGPDPFSQQGDPSVASQNSFEAGRQHQGVPLYSQHSQDSHQYQGYQQPGPQQRASHPAQRPQSGQFQNAQDPWTYHDAQGMRNTNTSSGSASYDSMLDTKLETIRTMLDNITQRLTAIEQKLGSDSRRW